MSAALAVSTPAVADAANRYAAPSGSGTSCTESSPCSLDEAVNGAGVADNDSVILIANPGTSNRVFNLSSRLEIGFTHSGLTLKGDSPAIKPTIHFDSSVTLPDVLIFGANTLIQDVIISNDSPGSSFSSMLAVQSSASGTKFNRCVLLANSEGPVLSAAGVEVHNSIVAAAQSTSGSAAALVNPGKVIGSTVLNRRRTGSAVLFSDSFYPLIASSALSAVIRNSILLGGGEIVGGGNGFDIDTQNGSLAPLTVDVAYSTVKNFMDSNAYLTPPAPNVTKGGGIADTALFSTGLDSADPVNSLRQASASATRNSGDDSYASSDLTNLDGEDVRGRPRKLGVTDMGADEALVAPSPHLTGYLRRGSTWVDFTSNVNPVGLDSALHIEFRKSVGAVWTDRSVATALSAFSEQPVSGRISGLSPHTRYYWRAYASNATGSSYDSLSGEFWTRWAFGVSGLKAAVRARSVDFTSTVGAPGAGKVSQVVTARIGGRTVTVCRAGKLGLTTDTGVALTCKAGRSVRNALRTGALKFKVSSTFTASSGAKQSAAVSIRVARRR